MGSEAPRKSSTSNTSNENYVTKEDFNQLKNDMSLKIRKLQQEIPFQWKHILNLQHENFELKEKIRNLEDKYKKKQMNARKKTHVKNRSIRPAPIEQKSTNDIRSEWLAEQRDKTRLYLELHSKLFKTCIFCHKKHTTASCDAFHPRHWTFNSWCSNLRKRNKEFHRQHRRYLSKIYNMLKRLDPNIVKSTPRSDDEESTKIQEV